MKQRNFGWSLLTALALGSGSFACQGDEDQSSQAPVEEGDTSTNTHGGSSGGGSSGTGGTDTGDTDTETQTPTGSNSEANCGNYVCVGHGSCKEDADGVPYCECDEGYVNNPQDLQECIVDEQCVQLRFLEDHCRQIYDGPPAVALFFALDFCSGTAVLPDKFQEIGLEFKILENGADIDENVESYAKVVESDVESYVALVLDVSDSITGSEDLPLLTQALKEFVTNLEPAAGEPPVNMAVYVFGKNVTEWIGWTPNLDSIVAKLTELETDPQSVVGLVGGDATVLYDATKRGIQEADRIRTLRHRVSNGGVLGTGTVVVVTDGKDTSNATLDTTLITTTLSQLISVGISHDIDGEDLDAIGRDASFLSPEPEDWAAAFAEITERVDQYPDRAYLLAYCSSATTGSPDVEISVEAPGVEVKRSARCAFNANLFSFEPDAVCTEETFDHNCDGAECGGLTPCGSCADDQCCAQGLCQAPENSPFDCDDQNELCELFGQICLDGETADDPDTCVGPVVVGDPCDDEQICEPTVSWCRTKDANDEPIQDPVCVSASPLGAYCEEGRECESLRCDKNKPNNPLEHPTCLEGMPGGRMFQNCGANAAMCEHGTYCNGTCVVRKWFWESCGRGAECHSTFCGETFSGTRGCFNRGSSGLCFWSWDEKINY